MALLHEVVVVRVLEVKAIDPAGLSPVDAGVFLSKSKRQIYNLIAEGRLVARIDGARTLVDFQSLKDYYAALPFKTAATAIANAPRRRHRRARS